MTKSNSKPSPAASSGPAWVEEYVPLASIQKQHDLQVRNKLDLKAVAQYTTMTEVGQVPPPIKVGRLGSALYLVDGWHRMEAGALQTSEDTFGTGEVSVLALVADLAEAEVRWEAARANMAHGVRLNRSEFRKVFKAFIKAGKHKRGRGELLSYREIAAELGVITFGTVRNWMKQDFPKLFALMGGNEHGNTSADAYPVEVIPLAEQQLKEWLASQAGLLPALPTMTPEGRWEVEQALHRALAEVGRLGVREPATGVEEPF